RRGGRPAPAPTRRSASTDPPRERAANATPQRVDSPSRRRHHAHRWARASATARAWWPAADGARALPACRPDRRARRLRLRLRQRRPAPGSPTAPGGWKPCERGCHDRIAAPLSFEDYGAGRISLDAIVVEIESVGQPEPLVEHIRPDERAGAIPAIFQHARNRRMTGCEAAGAVHANATLWRQLSRHDRDV